MDKIYLCFDTETTGFPDNWELNGLDIETWSGARLIELGCVLFTIENKNEEIKIIEKFNVLVDYVMDEKEFERSNPIHNITNEMLQESGVPIKDVLLKFKDMYNKADYILGHNIEFDVNVLLNELNLVDDDFKYTLVNERWKQLCSCLNTFSVYNNDIVIQPRLTYVRLSKLFETCFPNQTFEAHRALNDAIVTAECFVKLLYDE